VTLTNDTDRQHDAWEVLPKLLAQDLTGRELLNQGVVSFMEVKARQKGFAGKLMAGAAVATAAAVILIGMLPGEPPLKSCFDGNPMDQVQGAAMQLCKVSRLQRFNGASLRFPSSAL
jgi:hypothetical protein